MKLEKEVYVSDYGLGQNDTVIELTTLSQFNTDEFTTFDKILKNKKLKLTLEVEEPILDEEERKYLSGVIRPFRDDVEFICKNGTNVDSEYINIGYYKNDNTFLPCFKKGQMYKNMIINKEYKLEELGL